MISPQYVFEIHTCLTITKQSTYWSPCSFALFDMAFVCVIDLHHPINISLSKGHWALKSIPWFGFISWVTMGNKMKCISPPSIPLSGPDVADWIVTTQWPSARGVFKKHRLSFQRTSYFTQFLCCSAWMRPRSDRDYELRNIKWIWKKCAVWHF